MAKSKKSVLPKFLLAAASLLLIGLLTTAKTFGESELLNKPVDSQKTSSLSERVAERKKELKLELSSSAAERIQERCAEAQSKISELKEKNTVSIDTYYQTYGGIADQVATMINRLNNQAVSTAGIQTALNQYIDAVNQYLVNADLYKAALADMETVECEQDVEGFAASLQDGRKLRAKLAADAEAARTKVDSINAALINAKDKL